MECMTFLFWVILLTSPGLRISRNGLDCDDALVGVSNIKLGVMTKCAVLGCSWQTMIARYRLFWVLRVGGLRLCAI